MNNLNKINFKNRIVTGEYETFIDKIVAFLIIEKCTSAIVCIEDIDEIVESLTDQYTNVEIEDVDSEVDIDSEVFIVSKLEYTDEVVQIIVEPLFRKGKCIIHENDYIIMDADIFEEQMDFKVNAEFDGIEFIEYDESYDDSFDNENEDLEYEDTEEECDCENCNCDEDCECEDCEFTSDLVCLVEDALESLEDSCGCISCKREILIDLVASVLNITQKYSCEEVVEEETIEKELSLVDILEAITDAWKTMGRKDRNEF